MATTMVHESGNKFSQLSKRVGGVASVYSRERMTHAPFTTESTYVRCARQGIVMPPSRLVQVRSKRPMIKETVGMGKCRVLTAYLKFSN